MPLPPPTPAPSPRAFLASHARLFQILAVVLVGAAALYWWWGRSPASAQAQREVDAATQLVDALWRSSPSRDFSAVSARWAINAQLVPAAMIRPSGHPVRSAWGTPVDIVPHAVRAPADGFALRYHLLPPAACKQLAMELGKTAHSVRVGAHSIMGAQGPEPALVASACVGDANTVEFAFHPDLIPGTAVPRKR